MLKRFVSTGLLLTAGLAVAQEDYGQWSFVKDLTVNTTDAGIDVAEDVAKYPLLVRLGAADAAIFAQAGANGASLRFTKADGTTRLPHAIDHWNAAEQSAAVWVLVDTVYGNSATGADVKMYWGKVGAADSSDAGSVFTTDNGFLSVFHMGDGDETTPRPNAVSGRNPATPVNLPAGYAPYAGVIGTADSLGRTGGGGLDAEHFSFGPVTATDLPSSHLTISMWIKTPDPLQGPTHAITLAGPGNEFKQNNIYVARRWSNNIDFIAVADGNGDELGIGAPAWDQGNWQLIHAVLNGGVRGVYSNGTLAGASAVQTQPGILDRQHALIGATLWGDNAFDAVFDEVRLANVVRSGDWIKLDYATQVPGAAAVTLGATDTLNPFVIISDLRYESGNSDAIDTLGFATLGAVTFTPTYIGQTPDSFTVSGAVPAGLSFNASTGALSGTATAAFNAELTFTAHVGAETATRAVRITVVPGIANLRYVPTNTAERDTLYLFTGVSVSLAPEYDGGPADSVKLTGNTTTLPSGVFLNKTTGVISGAPMATFTGNRTVTAYFGSQTTVRPIRFVVALGPTAALAYSSEGLSARVGESVTGLVPSWSGRNPTGFSVSPALPAGLALDARSGIITGTPTAAAASAQYTVKAFNATDTTAQTLTIAVAAAAADGAYDSAWSGHATIRLNTKASGANVSGTVARFPVLVRLGAADSAIFDAAAADGKDIRFTRMNNTARLPHQIDHWNKAGMSAAVWVLVDTVRGNDSAQGFRMHWGNAAASGMSNGNAVFDTANGFVAVWHLGGGNETALRGNAVAGGYPAIPEFFPAGYEDRAGVVGRADTLRGGTQAAGDRLSLGSGYDDWGGAMTMSMWIKPHATDLGQWNQYISLSNGQGQDNIWMGRRGDGNNNFTTELWSGNQSGGHTDAADVQVQEEWQLLSWTVTGGTAVAMYRNGSEVMTGTSGQPLKDTLRTINHIGRAAWPDPTITAVVDEVRFSNVARSADWIKLEYANQMPGQKVVSIAYDTLPTAIAGRTDVGAPLSFRMLPEGVLFQIRSATPSKARIEIIDMQGRIVWNRTLAAGTGLSQVTWNGTARNGYGSGSGIYFVRMQLLDAGNRPTHRLERKLPLTR